MSSSIFEQMTDPLAEHYLAEVARQIRRESRFPCYNTGLDVFTIRYELVRSGVLEKVQSNGLYILLKDDHFFVFLYHASTKSAYMTDCMDETKDETQCMALAVFLGVVVKPIVCTVKLFKDFKGAAAIVLGLELLKMYKKGQLENGTMNPSKSKILRTVNQLYGNSENPNKKSSRHLRARTREHRSLKWTTATNATTQAET